MKRARPAPRARGEHVVKDVLAAAREELARVGYDALRIEDVAERADVNKTTVYRRWPTKPALVRATLVAFAPQGDPPVTASLRHDLLALVRMMVEFLGSADGKIILKMAMAEAAESDFHRLIDSIRMDREVFAKRVLEGARRRGELRADLDLDLFIAVLAGGLHHRIFMLREKPSKIDLEAHLDLLLSGALARSTPPRKRSKR